MTNSIFLTAIAVALAYLVFRFIETYIKRKQTFKNIST